MPSPSSSAQSSVDPGKLAPPRLPGRALPREALLTRLLEARRLRCVVIQGPVGYGKTTLLAAWRQALLPLGFDVAWLSLAAQDNDLERFLAGLIASLAEVDPTLVHEAAALAEGAIDPYGVERLTIGLVRRLAEHPRELVLMMDDVHHLGHPAILEALQWLLDNAPPRLHLVFGTRRAPRLSLDRLRAQRQTLELGFGELRFKLPESGELLRQQLGEVDARTVKLLHELTEGWAAGLQLFAASLKSRGRIPGHQGDAFMRGQVHDSAALGRYIEAEVLSALAPPDLEILVSVSACSRFSASLAAALVERPDGLADASALLLRLTAEDLFITEVPGTPAERCFRLHPLLREVLLARLQARSPDQQRQLHARAWAWLRDHGQIDEAIDHAVRAGEAAAAAGLIEQRAQALVLSGERRKLFDLVARLPPEQLQSRLKLRLWLALSQLQRRELDACAAGVAQLSTDILPEDAEDRYTLALLRAALALQRDDTETALAVLPQLMEAPPGTNAVVIGGRNNILSWLYLHRGEFEHARRVQLDAPPPLVGGVPLLGTPAGSLQGRCLVGLSYALEGQMAQAERTYRAVLREAALCGRTGVDPAALATALLGDVLYERNDTQAARQLLEERIDVLERVSIPDSALRVFRVLAASHWLARQPQEAFAWLDRLEAYARRHGLERLLAYSLGDRMVLHLLLGEHGSAQERLRQLDEVHSRHAAAGANVLDEIDELAQRAHVNWQIAMRDDEAAAAKLAPLIELCETRGRFRSATQLQLQRAIVDARCGRAQAAADHVVAALQRGHRLGLLRTLVDAAPGAGKLIGEVAQGRRLDPVLAFYVEQLQATRAVPRRSGVAAVSPSTAAPVESFNERELDVLRLLAQAMPNKKIARALNRSPETVKWYLSRIYGKLQVSGRDEAVARLRDLGWGDKAEPGDSKASGPAR